MHCIVGLLLLLAGLATAAPLQQTNLLATDNSTPASSRPFSLQDLKSNIEAKLDVYTQAQSENLDTTVEFNEALWEYSAALKAKATAAAGKDEALKNATTQFFKKAEKKLSDVGKVAGNNSAATVSAYNALAEAIIKMEAEVIKHQASKLSQLPREQQSPSTTPEPKTAAPTQTAQPEGSQQPSLQQSPSPQPESNPLGATVQPAQQQSQNVESTSAASNLASM